MKQYMVILAGGNGTRLWPISRKRRPKQFLNLYSEDIMINETIKRVETLFDLKNIFIVLNQKQKRLADKYIDKRIPKENIIMEPKAKNTAMCIFYTSLKIKKIHGDGITCVLSSDHYIRDISKFINTIRVGIEIAEKNENIVTIGIKPTYPSTDFGYIKYKKETCETYYNVEQFVEKPSLQVAEEFLKSNQYMWNSGMFLWKIDTILKKFKIFLPDIANYIEELYPNILKEGEEAKIKEIYNSVQSISIDKGILEKSKNIKMVIGDFDWMDIGNLRDLFEVYPKDKCLNTAIGNIKIEDSSGTNVFADKNSLIVALGVNNLTIIKNKNVCFICDNKKLYEVKNIMKNLEAGENKKYL